MSILINKDTRILVQGITGKHGSFHAEQCLAYRSKIVAGVTPGKGGTKFMDKVPIFNSVAEAAKATGATVSAIFVPPPFAADAILECVDANLDLAVAITEGIPVKDMVRVKRAMAGKRTRLVGPNCPGLVTPGPGLEARHALALVRDAEQAAGADRVRPVLADVAVLIGTSAAEAADDLAALDAAAGASYAATSDAAVLATTVPELVEHIAGLRALGYAGVRLRPLRIPEDSTAIARRLVPALVTAGLRADVASRPTADLRTRLGLAPAVSRHATEGVPA